MQVNSRKFKSWTILHYFIATLIFSCNNDSNSEIRGNENDISKAKDEKNQEQQIDDPKIDVASCDYSKITLQNLTSVAGFRLCKSGILSVSADENFASFERSTNLKPESDITIAYRKDGDLTLQEDLLELQASCSEDNNRLLIGGSTEVKVFRPSCRGIGAEMDASTNETTAPTEFLVGESEEIKKLLGSGCLFYLLMAEPCP